MDALATYEKITGIDLSNHPFDAALKQAKSPGAILELLQKRENEFKDFRDEFRKLINFISPVVTVIQRFSGVLGAVVSLPVVTVSQACNLVTLLTSSGPPTGNCGKGNRRCDRCPPLCSSLNTIFNRFLHIVQQHVSDVLVKTNVQPCACCRESPRGPTE